MSTPRNVTIKITNDCNLRCTYCSHFEGRFTGVGGVTHDVSTEEWLNFFDELGRCNVMNVTLQGGEPFYRRDIRTLIDGIVRNRMRFSILTNGILVDDDMAAFLVSTGRCNSVQVSIDGVAPAAHDVFRGKGTFEKALAGLKALLRHRVPSTVRVTIHKKNLHELDTIAHMLLEEIGLPSFSTNSVSYLGACRDNADQLMLDAEQRSVAMRSLLALERKYPGRITATAGPLADGRMWMEMERARREGRPRAQGCGSLTSCGVPFNGIAVRPDGVYVPCTEISHVELGRINHDPLPDIWRHNQELQALRHRQKIELNDFSLCRTCDYRPYCRGGCPALAYTLTGDMDQPSPDICLKQFLDQGGQLPDMDELSVAGGVA